MQERLAQLIAAAEAALMAQTGGGNLCQLSKAGQPLGSAKYYEGRLVALRAASRTLRGATGDPALLIAPLLARWEADLATQQDRPQPAAAWLAYAQGGVEALRELEEA
ncbi:MAG: hypothetical protein AB4911_15810 [Oscillochloridaceae bacterium umkhey_bin13]